VGIYLRETRRTNRDGSVVRCLQLAHNERNRQTGVPTAKVIHNFGRAEAVDRTALARLVASISRFLDAVAAAAGAEVEIPDSGGWVGRGLSISCGSGWVSGRRCTGRRPVAG
jgi:hypothetical protein